MLSARRAGQRVGVPERVSAPLLTRILHRMNVCKQKFNIQPPPRFREIVICVGTIRQYDVVRCFRNQTVVFFLITYFAVVTFIFVIRRKKKITPLSNTAKTLSRILTFRNGFSEKYTKLYRNTRSCPTREKKNNNVAKTVTPLGIQKFRNPRAINKNPRKL